MNKLLDWDAPLIIGKALAGHFLDADAGKAGRNMTKFTKRYANPLSDWIALLVAEVKLLPAIDVDALVAERLRREAEINERNRLRAQGNPETAERSR